jgi:opacity protein-like surface antigen
MRQHLISACAVFALTTSSVAQTQDCLSGETDEAFDRTRNRVVENYTHGEYSARHFNLQRKDLPSSQLCLVEGVLAEGAKYPIFMAYANLSSKMNVFALEDRVRAQSLYLFIDPDKVGTLSQHDSDGNGAAVEFDEHFNMTVIRGADTPLADNILRVLKATKIRCQGLGGLYKQKMGPG